MKKISIIVPCYNAEKYIERCINSLIHQTIGIENLEIILINDASTDRTLEYLMKYEKQYPESILVINCTENQKQGAARNLGLTYASADYIGYVDADDWCELDMYKEMYGIATENNCDIVVCKYIRDDGESTKNNIIHEKKGKLLTLTTAQETSDFIAFGEMGIAPWSKLCKKQLLLDNNIYFPENTIYEDNFWNGLLYLYAKKVYIMNSTLYHYFINTNSTILSKDCDKHYALFDVCLAMWQEYENRNAFEKYKEALEYNFIRCYYWQGLKMLCLRFSHPSYEIFLQMLETIRTLIPNYMVNYYVQNHTKNYLVEQLKLIQYVPSQNDFQILIELIRKQ